MIRKLILIALGLFAYAVLLEAAQKQILEALRSFLDTITRTIPL